MKPLRFRIRSIVESSGGVFPGAKEAARSVEVRGDLVDDGALAFHDGDLRIRLTPEELKAEGWGHDTVVSLPVETASADDAAKVVAAISAKA